MSTKAKSRMSVKPMKVAPNVTDPLMRNSNIVDTDELLREMGEDTDDIEQTKKEILNSKIKTKEEDVETAPETNTLLIIVFALIVIALVALIVWMVTKQNDSKKQEEEELKARLQHHPKNTMPLMQQRGNQPNIQPNQQQLYQMQMQQLYQQQLNQQQLNQQQLNQQQLNQQQLNQQQLNQQQLNQQQLNQQQLNQQQLDKSATQPKSNNQQQLDKSATQPKSNNQSKSNINEDNVDELEAQSPTVNMIENDSPLDKNDLSMIEKMNAETYDKTLDD